jgi:polyhydroxybutyrate depolymerase
MKKNIAAACCYLFFSVFLACAKDAKPLPSSPEAGRFTLKIQSGKLERTAHIHIPKGYKPGTKPPLVLLLHGGGGTGPATLQNDGWAAKADKEGFLLVAPDGLGVRPKLPTSFKTNPAIWNSGQYAANSEIAAIDDVEFIRQLLDELKEKLPYDEDCVFCTGHSNGGGMTFRLAAELSERFTSVGMVAGRLVVDPLKIKKPMPTLYIVGTKDPLMPMEGGEVKSPWAGNWKNQPIAEQLTRWAVALGCEKEPKIVSDQDAIRKVEYLSKTTGPTLTVFYLDGHGHHWPGAKRTLPESMIGPIISKLDATDTLWDFFKTSAAAKK